MATTSTNNTNHTATQYHTHALCEFSPWMDWSTAVEESPTCSANNCATKSRGHPRHSCYWAARTLAIVPSALCNFSPWIDRSTAAEESPTYSADNRATEFHGHPRHSCYWAARTLAIVPSLFQGQQWAPAKATHVPFGVASLARTTTWNAVVIIILGGEDSLRTSGPCRKKACHQIFSGPRDCRIAVRSSLTKNIHFEMRRNLMKNCFFELKINYSRTFWILYFTIGLLNYWKFLRISTKSWFFSQ